MIWWYPEKASRKHRSSLPAVESTMRSIRGSGKGSLGQALFKSVKSMQSRYLKVMGFGTTTGLATQVGCGTILMTPASSSLSTSDTINSSFSLLCLRRTCFIGRASSLTASLCSITSLGTPGKPDASHAKTSEFSQRKAMSALSYLSSRCAPVTSQE